MLEDTARIAAATLVQLAGLVGFALVTLGGSPPAVFAWVLAVPLAWGLACLPYARARAWIPALVLGGGLLASAVSISFVDERLDYAWSSVSFVLVLELLWQLARRWDPEQPRLGSRLAQALLVVAFVGSCCAPLGALAGGAPRWQTQVVAESPDDPLERVELWDPSSGVDHLAYYHRVRTLSAVPWLERELATHFVDEDRYAWPRSFEWRDGQLLMHEQPPSPGAEPELVLIGSRAASGN